MTIANDYDDYTFNLAEAALVDHNYCQVEQPSYGYRLPELRTKEGTVNEYLLRVINTHNGETVLQPVTVRFCIKEGGHEGDEDRIICLCSECIESPQDVEEELSLSSTNMNFEFDDQKKLDLLPHVSSGFLPVANFSSNSFTNELPSTSKEGFGLFPPQQPPIFISAGINSFSSMNRTFPPTKYKTQNKTLKERKRRKTIDLDDEDFLKDEQPTTKKRRRKSVHHKDLSCYHCEKTFANQGNLQKHLHKALGILPYICPNCQEGFLLKKLLKAHNCDQIIQERASSAVDDDDVQIIEEDMSQDGLNV